MQARPLSLDFSVADGEDVSLDYDGETLVLSFTDWQERNLRVRFSDVVGFRWQRVTEVLPGEAWDGANELTGSAWAEDHRRLGEATPEHKHLPLNFNAAGRLDVLCIEISGAEVMAG